MNNEIKEILDLLEDTADLSFFAVCGTKEEMKNMPKCISKRLAITDEQAKLLLDYITNLQQENERLKKPDYYEKGLIGSIKERDEIIQDYKSRCEKAIEMIEKQKKKMYKSRNKIALFILMKLENILQNGDVKNGN